ncbi:hypothetical protein PspLS_00216 [Pyricularia sp. CBS 133598]|nr:hypothetical protein PspLS_00216 [Pyricularia sp. CBS 133598]
MSPCMVDSLNAAQLLGAEHVGFSGAAGTTHLGWLRPGEGEGSERRPMIDHQSLMERTTLYHGLKELGECDFREPDNFTVQENIFVFADSEDNLGLGDNQNKPKMLPAGGQFVILREARLGT